jgi:chromosome segregation ATPase
LNLSTHKKSEVDLRVSQELKNNRDFIYETNCKLQALSQGMISLSVGLEKCLSKSESERTLIKIDVEKIAQFVTRNILEMEQRIGNIETRLDHFQESLDGFQEDVSLRYATRKEVVDMVVPEARRIDLVGRDGKKNYDYLNLAISQLRENFAQRLEVAKKEAYQPPKEDPLVQIHDKLRDLQGNLDGLYQEIARVKKSLDYDQKRFENVYTLIDRLKVGR